MKHSGITRRTALAGAIGTAAAIAAAPAFAQPANRRQPNILFIMADDLGYADLSCYGRRDYQTPVLDKLASEGMMLTHAYANSAVCTATRVGLITGRYQYRLRVGLEEPIATGNENLGLDPDHPTLPSLLREQGYRTSLVGKWHLGLSDRFGPLSSGYESFYGVPFGAADYFRHNQASGVARSWQLFDGAQPANEDGYLTDLFSQRAAE